MVERLERQVDYLRTNFEPILLNVHEDLLLEPLPNHIVRPYGTQDKGSHLLVIELKQELHHLY